MRFLSHDTHIDKININSIDKKNIAESINKSKNGIDDEYKAILNTLESDLHKMDCEP